MTIAEQTAKLVESLPPDKAKMVLEFAQFLVDQADVEEWDRLCEKAAQSPSFQAFVEQVRLNIAEGKSTPLDPNDL